MTLRAIIFDMDGVLVDSEPVHFEATRALLADYGVSYAPADGENFFGCTDQDVFRALKARYGLLDTEEAMAQAWVARVVRLLPHRVTPLAGVPGVLHEARRRGLRLALASSSAPAVIETTLQALGIADAFDLRVSGHDVAQGKPSPQIFLEAASRLGLPPAECVVVEDSLNGLRAAVAAGIRCAVVPCASTAHQDFAGADCRLRSLHELPAWLDDLARG